MKLTTRFKRGLTFAMFVSTLFLNVSACNHSSDGADTQFPREAFAFFK